MLLKYRVQNSLAIEVASVDFKGTTLNDVFLKFTCKHIITDEDQPQGGFVERYAKYHNRKYNDFGESYVSYCNMAEGIQSFFKAKMCVSSFYICSIIMVICYRNRFRIHCQLCNSCFYY